MRGRGYWALVAVLAAFPAFAADAPAMPEGRLTLMGKERSGFVFFAKARRVPGGDVIEATTLEVRDIQVTLARGPLVYRVASHRLDCGRRTRQVVASAGYDGRGVLVAETGEEPAHEVVQDGGYDLLMVIACGDETLAGAPVVDGPGEAALLSRDLLNRGGF